MPNPTSVAEYGDATARRSVAYLCIFPPNSLLLTPYSLLLTPVSSLLMKKALIIDDDPMIAQTVGAALASAEFEVIVGRDGTEGLALAERESPDLVVVDMMMPRRSGFLVIESLRQAQKFPCRIIMNTANEGVRHQKYAQELGVDAYLHKPFTMDFLLQTVKRIMGKEPEDRS